MKDIYKNTVKAKWITEKSTDTQYAIEETDDVVTIKFQGSHSRIDWFQNILFWKKPYKKMGHLFFIHSGFLAKYKSIQDIILKAGRSAVAHGKIIQILGYSQGAAIGMIATEDLKFHYPNGIIKTTVFGCPRVFSIFGQKELKKRLQSVTRVENGNDIVTKLPLRIQLYKHYGIAKHIGKKRRWWKLSAKDHTGYKENL